MKSFHIDHKFIVVVCKMMFFQRGEILNGKNDSWTAAAKKKCQNDSIKTDKGIQSFLRRIVKGLHLR